MLTKLFVPSFCDLVRSHQHLRCVIVNNCRLDLDDLISVLYAVTCQNLHGLSILELANCRDESGERIENEDWDEIIEALDEFIAERGENVLDYGEFIAYNNGGRSLQIQQL